MLKIQNLSKSFGNKQALNQVSLEVKPGEIFCIIGPNGSGKTTLVKTVAGLLRPSGGEVIINGFNISQEPRSAKAAIGYIPDEPTVWSAVTGEEFLHLVGALYNMKPEQRREEINKLLPVFELADMAQDYFDGYSRGSKQKFSILAALMHQPKLLLVDEPIVGLDPTSSDIAKQQFVKFAEQGGSVLMVTHTLPVAQEIATRIGLLYNGQLKAQGSLNELRNQAGLNSNASLEEIYQKLVAK